MKFTKTFHNKESLIRMDGPSGGKGILFLSGSASSSYAASKHRAETKKQKFTEAEYV